MKTKFLTRLAIAGLSITAQTTHAQQQRSDTAITLTLDQVWEKAAVHSRVVQIRHIQQNSSEEFIKAAKNERFPEIGVGGEYARITNMPVYDKGLFSAPSQFEVLHSTYTAETEAYLNLYNGGKTNTEIAARQTENKIAAEQTGMTLSATRLEAAACYLDIQRSIIFIGLMKKDIETQEKQLQQLRNLKANGVILKSDVLRAELKLSRQQLALATLQNDRVVANEKLNIIIGLPKNQLVQPTETIDSLPQKPLDDYRTDEESKAYQLRISEQETALGTLKVKAEKAKLAPKIGLFGTFRYSYPQIFLYPYAPYAYSIGLGGIKAHWDLSSLYHNNHKIRAAALDLEAREVEHAQVKDKITQQVDEAWLRLQEALNRIDVSKANILQATENKRIVSNAYFNQTALITDLLDADTQLLQTRFDLAAAQIAAQLQYLRLQNITGNL